MSRCLIVFLATFLLFSCTRDYIEVDEVDESSGSAYEVSSAYVNVDSIEFTLQYNDPTLLHTQIRRDTNEIPLTVWDGKAICIDSSRTATCTDNNVSPNVTYHYAFLYTGLNISSALAQSKSYTALSYVQGMYTTVTELISHINNKSSSLEIILAGETMDFYDDSSIIQYIDGVLISALNYSDLDTISPSKDANIAKINPLQSAYPNLPFFSLDYTMETTQVSLTRTTADDNDIISFNRSLSTANIETLSTNLPSIYNSNIDPVTSLANVKNYIFLDKPIPNLITQLQSENYDLIILTPFNTYPISSLTSRYSASDIASIGTKPGVEVDRLVYAYFDVGLAIKSSYYWEESWVDVDSYPDWIADGYESSTTDYMIKYWSSDWKTIIKAMIDSILSDGYDGIVIGGTHHYRNFPLSN